MTNNLPNSAAAVKIWCAAPPETLEENNYPYFSHGPMQSLDNLIACNIIPEGHIIIGMTKKGKEVIRGIIQADQKIIWDETKSKDNITDENPQP